MFRRPRSPHAGARPNPTRPAGPGRRPARLECTRLEDRATPVIGAFGLVTVVAGLAGLLTPAVRDA